MKISYNNRNNYANNKEIRHNTGAGNILDDLDDYFVVKPPLLRTPRTVQILLLRQTHDYTIFRTEETREINTVVIPKSISKNEQTTRVVFLGCYYLIG